MLAGFAGNLDRLEGTEADERGGLKGGLQQPAGGERLLFKLPQERKSALGKSFIIPKVIPQKLCALPTLESIDNSRQILCPPDLDVACCSCVTRSGLDVLAKAKRAEQQGKQAVKLSFVEGSSLAPSDGDVSESAAASSGLDEPEDSGDVAGGESLKVGKSQDAGGNPNRRRYRSQFTSDDEQSEAPGDRKSEKPGSRQSADSRDGLGDLKERKVEDEREKEPRGIGKRGREEPEAEERRRERRGDESGKAGTEERVDRRERGRDGERSRDTRDYRGDVTPSSRGTERDGRDYSRSDRRDYREDRDYNHRDRDNRRHDRGRRDSRGTEERDRRDSRRGREERRRDDRRSSQWDDDSPRAGGVGGGGRVSAWDMPSPSPSSSSLRWTPSPSPVRSEPDRMQREPSFVPPSPSDSRLPSAWDSVANSPAISAGSGEATNDCYDYHKCYD